MFCLFVPQLHVWDFRIYEITGQVKGHSWEVKWEAKIYKTKEMTGQCQMKGQKSSDRLSVDESKWCLLNVWAPWSILNIRAHEVKGS